jgi:hypothetical protein
MLNEIRSSGKTITIRPIQGSYTVNCCRCAPPSRFVRLRGAVERSDKPAIVAELTWTLAQIPDLSLVKLAQAVAFIRRSRIPTEQGMLNEQRRWDPLPAVSAAEYMGIYDLLYRTVNGQNFLSTEFRETVVKGGYSTADGLVRSMKPVLRAGAGASSTIFFDVTAETSCGNDGRPTRRPIFIGLAHELCHAWRNATGMRFFDDYNSSNFWDDELMTVGITPYLNEPINENLFRNVAQVALRQRYR